MFVPRLNPKSSDEFVRLGIRVLHIHIAEGLSPHIGHLLYICIMFIHIFIHIYSYIYMYIHE